MKTQLTTWLFLGVAAYVLLSAFHGCVDSKLEAEKRPAPTPTAPRATEPVEVRAPRPTGPVAPVQIGQGAAESLASGQAAEIPAASMHFPPLTAEEPSSGPFAERMAAAAADGTLSPPLSMHMPCPADEAAGRPDDAAGALADEELVARNPDVAVLAARLERQRQTIAELKREIGVLRAAKEDLLDEVDRARAEAAAQAAEDEENDQTAGDASGPVEHEDSGDRDMRNDELPPAAGGAVATLGQGQDDCGCDETPVVAPPASEAESAR